MYFSTEIAHTTHSPGMCVGLRKTQHGITNLNDRAVSAWWKSHPAFISVVCGGTTECHVYAAHC